MVYLPLPCHIDLASSSSESNIWLRLLESSGNTERDVLRDLHGRGKGAPHGRGSGAPARASGQTGSVWFLIGARERGHDE